MWHPSKSLITDLYSDRRQGVPQTLVELIQVRLSSEASELLLFFIGCCILHPLHQQYQTSNMHAPLLSMLSPFLGTERPTTQAMAKR